MEKENRYLFRGKPIDEFNEFREDLDPALDDWKNIIKENGFIYGSLIWNDGSPFIVGDIADWGDEYIAHEYWCPVKPETVGQYSTFNCENKDKIFDGDIVLLRDDGWGKEPELNLVSHNEGAFFVSPKSTPNLFECMTSHNVVFIEVVGNIFDNPELLEVK